MAVQVLKRMGKRPDEKGKPKQVWMEVTVLKRHPNVDELEKLEKGLQVTPKAGPGVYKIKGDGRTQTLIVEGPFTSEMNQQRNFVKHGFVEDRSDVFDDDGVSGEDYSEELEAIAERLENIEKILAAQNEKWIEIMGYVEKAKSVLSPEMVLGFMAAFNGKGA